MADKLVQVGARKPQATSVPLPVAAADAKRVYIETYGCQMNVADTDMVTGLLLSEGYQVTKDAKAADVILINTCAVREKAEDRVYARAKELGALKRGNDKVLGIVGCMAEHLREKIADRETAVDVIIGPDSYRRLPALVKEAMQKQEARRVEPDAELVAVGPQRVQLSLRHRVGDGAWERRHVVIHRGQGQLGATDLSSGHAKPVERLG